MDILSNFPLFKYPGMGFTGSYGKCKFNLKKLPNCFPK